MSSLLVRIVLLTVFFFPGLVLAQGSSESVPAVDFSARTLGGKKIQLKNYLAKGPVLLDFWALWCVPCLKELPKIKKLQNQYKKHGLTVIAVNEDSPSDQTKVKPFVKQKRLDFVVVFDEDKDLWNQFKIVSLPTTILLNPAGNIIYTHTGYKPGDEVELRKVLDRLFTPKPSPSKSEE